MATKFSQSVIHRYDDLKAMILGRVCVRYGKLDYEQWAQECGISHDTLRRRVASPEDLTLKELRDITLPFAIPSEDLRKVIPL